MHITLYSALSADGLIATNDHDSDWVSEVDLEVFNKTILDAGCMILGKTTFFQYPKMFPMPGVLNVVMTHDASLKSDAKDVFFAAGSLENTVKEMEARGIERAVLIGGGKTNASFIKANLIDELILSIHPLLLGQGIQLFEGAQVNLKLELVGVKELREDLVQLKYEVIK